MNDSRFEVVRHDENLVIEHGGVVLYDLEQFCVKLDLPAVCVEFMKEHGLTLALLIEGMKPAGSDKPFEDFWGLLMEFDFSDLAGWMEEDLVGYQEVVTKLHLDLIGRRAGSVRESIKKVLLIGLRVEMGRKNDDRFPLMWERGKLAAAMKSPRRNRPRRGRR
jgi:hypothetical protein